MKSILGCYPDKKVGGKLTHRECMVRHRESIIWSHWESKIIHKELVFTDRVGIIWSHRDSKIIHRELVYKLKIIVYLPSKFGRIWVILGMSLRLRPRDIPWKTHTLPCLDGKYIIYYTKE